VAACCLSALHVNARAQRDSTSQTRIVLLGTGTPSPDPERSGPATAIVVNGTPYLIEELRAHYSGRVVTGHDLDVY
jgi:hypothetical protein